MMLMTMLVTWNPLSHHDLSNALFISLFNSLNMVVKIDQHIMLS